MLTTLDVTGPATLESVVTRLEAAERSGGANVPGPLPERAPSGRVLIAVLPMSGSDDDAERLATRLCLALAPSIPHPSSEILTAYAPVHDLAHWARADALRAELAEPLELTLCGHDGQAPAHRHLLVLEAPASYTGRILATLNRVQEPLGPLAAGAVLTEAGWIPVPWAAMVPGTSEGATTAARHAIVAQAHRHSGRAIVFPGQQHLRDDLPTADVLSRTAIDVVSGPAGPAPAGAVVRCHGYARPRYRNGALALPVAYDRPDLVSAVETRHSHPCRGDAHP